MRPIRRRALVVCAFIVAFLARSSSPSVHAADPALEASWAQAKALELEGLHTAAALIYEGILSDYPDSQRA